MDFMKNLRTVNDEIYTRKDILDEEGRPTNIVIGTLAEVLIDDLLEEALRILDIALLSDAQANHIDRAFRIYKALAHYLLLNEEEDNSLPLFLIDFAAKEIDLSVEQLTPHIQSVIDQSREMADQFIVSKEFQDYYGKLED